MSDWIKLEPWEGPIHQGCMNCPPVERTAPMDMMIAVGFGVAQVTRDPELVWSEPRDPQSWDELWTTADAERAAAADPDHDWRILLDAPLRMREYQRHGPGEWVLVASGPGFA